MPWDRFIALDVGVKPMMPSGRISVNVQGFPRDFSVRRSYWV